MQNEMKFIVTSLEKDGDDWVVTLQDKSGNQRRFKVDEWAIRENTIEEAKEVMDAAKEMYFRVRFNKNGVIVTGVEATVRQGARVRGYEKKSRTPVHSIKPAIANPNNEINSIRELITELKANYVARGYSEEDAAKLILTNVAKEMGYYIMSVIDYDSFVKYAAKLEKDVKFTTQDFFKFVGQLRRDEKKHLDWVISEGIRTKLPVFLEEKKSALAEEKEEMEV